MEIYYRSDTTPAKTKRLSETRGEKTDTIGLKKANISIYILAKRPAVAR